MGAAGYHPDFSLILDIAIVLIDFLSLDVRGGVGGEGRACLWCSFSK